MTIADPYTYAEAGIGAPEPVEHEIAHVKVYPGRHGDIRAPEERAVHCLCGEHLGSLWEGGREDDIRAEFAAHVEEVGRADR